MTHHIYKYHIHLLTKVLKVGEAADLTVVLQGSQNSDVDFKAQMSSIVNTVNDLLKMIAFLQWPIPLVCASLRGSQVKTKVSILIPGKYLEIFKLHLPSPKSMKL